MNNYEKITAKSEAIQSQTPIPANVKKLQELFPDVVQDGQVDFDALRQLLGESIAESDERYGLQWPGKNAARLEALTPSTKTLRPCEADSKDWPTTKNLYIEGDNFEVLKLLQKSYSGKIKMIYIDPPYNTGKDSFIYRDDYRMSREEYMEASNQSRNFRKNQKDSGRFHSNWLNMMYPRLILARELLRDDGVIFINIDEHEVNNLQTICAEIFGANNELGVIIWDKKNPKGDAKGISYQHEYILLYARNRDFLTMDNKLVRPKKNAKIMITKANQLYAKINENYTLEQVNSDFSSWLSKQKSLSNGELAYNKIDKDGKLYQAVSMAWPNRNQAPNEYFIPLIHPVTGRECTLPARGWRNPPSTMQSLMQRGLILFGPDETTQPRRKYLLEENMDEKISSMLYYGGSDTDLLAQLRIPFDTPKVVDICKEHIMSFTKSDDIILDFFSGSATTAHAVMQLNAEDSGNRRFIMVQYPEVCDEKTDAAKAGFTNICEIGKERIRRAGKKIKDAAGENAEKLDTGFRVFKVDESNVIPWDTNPEKFEEQLLKEAASESGHLQEGRTSDDFFYEVLLKQGIELTQDFEEQEIAGHKVYSLGSGMYYCCFDERIRNEAADLAAGIAEWHNEQDPDGKDCVVFVRDSSFDDANVMHGTDARESDARKQSFCATLVQSGIMKVKAF